MPTPSSGGTAGYDESFIATESLASAQYQFVMISGTGVAKATANSNAIGIVQNAPGSGEAAQVRVLGISKLKVLAANPNIVAGQGLESGDANGAGIKTTVAEHVVAAIALEPATVDNAYISVLLTGRYSYPT